MPRKYASVGGLVSGGRTADLVGVLIGCFRAVWMANFEKMLFFFCNGEWDGTACLLDGFFGDGCVFTECGPFFSSRMGAAFLLGVDWVCFLLITFRSVP
jgi:hypothetical protein